MAMDTHEKQLGQKRKRNQRRERRVKIDYSWLTLNSPPGVIRNVPTYDLLSEEGLLAIEAQADRILEEIGLEFRGDPYVLSLWQKAGALVKGEWVRFPKGLLRGILKTAPETFVQHSRNPKRSVVMGGNNVVMSPAYGSPFVQDLDQGRRYGTLDDFENFVKLTYAAPYLHFSGGTVCEPVDVPVNKRHLDMVAAHLRYSDKPFMGAVTAKDRAEESIELVRTAFGADYVENHCVIMGNINVNSPLVFDKTMTDALITYAGANQAVVVSSFLISGAMGPVTMPGVIAQCLAETMTGCALAQLVRPGAPVIFGNFLSTMALRSGAPTFGTPEPVLGSYVMGQLVRRLKLPLRCAGGYTASKLPDAQAMSESIMSMMASIHSGSNFTIHSAGWLEGGLVMGYEKFILDVDFCGNLHTFLKGLSLDENQLAHDAFTEIGIGKHYLGCAHTQSNYQSAFWESAASDSSSFEQWRDMGEYDAAKRANAIWKKLLAEYERPYIDPSVDEAITDYIDRKKASRPDEWY